MAGSTICQHRQPQTWRRSVVACLLSVSGGACLIPPASGAELLVVRQDGCSYCERFEREIAPAWPHTDEGREVPLRRLDLHAAWPADLQAVEPATVTPTFILVEAGRELGRLHGYAGDEHFWFLIGQLTDRIATAEPAADRQSGPHTTGTQ